MGLPAPVSTFLLQKSEGNPLFAQEFCSALVARGYISVKDGQLTVLRDVSRMTELPEAVQNVLRFVRLVRTLLC